MSSASEHTKLYRFSPSDYLELAAVFNGTHPETGDPLDYAPKEIAEIARRLRQELACRMSRRASSRTTPGAW